MGRMFPIQVVFEEMSSVTLKATYIAPVSKLFVLKLLAAVLTLLNEIIYLIINYFANLLAGIMDFMSRQIPAVIGIFQHVA